MKEAEPKRPDYSGKTLYRNGYRGSNYKDGESDMEDKRKSSMSPTNLSEQEPQFEKDKTDCIMGSISNIKSQSSSSGKLENEGKKKKVGKSKCRPDPKSSTISGTLRTVDQGGEKTQSVEGVLGERGPVIHGEHGGSYSRSEKAEGWTLQPGGTKMFCPGKASNLVPGGNMVDPKVLPEGIEGQRTESITHPCAGLKRENKEAFHKPRNSIQTEKCSTEDTKVENDPTAIPELKQETSEPDDYLVDRYNNQTN